MGQKYDIRDQYGQKVGTLEDRNISPEQIVGVIILFFLGIGFIMWFMGFIFGAVVIPIAVLSTCLNMLKTGEIWQFKRWLALGFVISIFNMIMTFLFLMVITAMFFYIPYAEEYKEYTSFSPIIWLLIVLITVLISIPWGCLLIAPKLTPDILRDLSRPSNNSSITGAILSFGMKSSIYIAWIGVFLYLILIVISLF